MPNPHAIYLHDTPSKALFNADIRAFSHGCIRMKNADLIELYKLVDVDTPVAIRA